MSGFEFEFEREKRREDKTINKVAKKEWGSANGNGAIITSETL